MSYSVQTYVAVNVCAPASHPSASVFLPPGYTLTCGGAFDIWQSPGLGNILTASNPIQSSGGAWSGWYAAGKDHDFLVDPAPLAVFAIGITVNGGAIPVYNTVTQATGAQAQHPTSSVNVASGYLCTGGGASDNYGSGVGNMLTGSYPLLDSDGTGTMVGWQAVGKDQLVPDPSTVTAYAVGIQIPDLPAPGFGISSSATQTSLPGEYPTVSVFPGLDDNTWVIGGGANDVYTGVGNLLTASYPIFSTNTGTITGWTASGKDQGTPDPSGTVTVYAITLTLPDA